MKGFAYEGVPYVETQGAVGVEACSRQIRSDPFIGYDGPELIYKTLLSYVRHYAYRHPSEPERVTA